MKCSVRDLSIPFDLAGMPRRVVPLVLGYEPIQESLSVRGGEIGRAHV